MPVWIALILWLAFAVRTVAEGRPPARIATPPLHRHDDPGPLTYLFRELLPGLPPSSPPGSAAMADSRTSMADGAARNLPEAAPARGEMPRLGSAKPLNRLD